MSLNDIAKQYIGITEKPNNGGFSDADFERRMKKDGEWQQGWAWCACFVQLCVAEYKGEYFSRFDNYFTPSVLTTFRNLQQAGFYVSKVPQAGMLVFWQHFHNGKPTAQGHVGIVDYVHDNGAFSSIEGNTNARGAREGDAVAVKVRECDFAIPKYGNGLRLLGFIRV